MSKQFFTQRPAQFLCVITGCGAAVSRLTIEDVFCHRYWTLVPSDIKRILERRYRPNKLHAKHWTKRFTRAVDQAINEVLQISLSGHRIPKPQDFMFDEP